MIYRDQLEAVYRLIERPEAWTQGQYARNSENAKIDIDYNADAEYELNEYQQSRHPDACKWCLFGAAMKCKVVNSLADDPAFSNAFGFAFSGDVANFNDTHTHAEVLALLTSAINRAPVRP